jgi:hypothetical protein
MGAQGTGETARGKMPLVTYAPKIYAMPPPRCGKAARIFSVHPESAADGKRNCKHAINGVY